jgi:hypothetical protein
MLEKKVASLLLISLIIGFVIGFMVNSQSESGLDYFASSQYQTLEDSEKLKRPEYEKLESGIKAQNDISLVAQRGHFLSDVNETTETMLWTGKYVRFDFICASNQSSGNLYIQIYFPNNTLFSSNKVSGTENHGTLLFKLQEEGEYYFRFIPEQTAYSIFISEFS